MLREKVYLLQKHDGDLFGKKFRSHITETTKSKKQAMEMFCERGENYDALQMA